MTARRLSWIPWVVAASLSIGGCDSNHPTAPGTAEIVPAPTAPLVGVSVVPNPLPLVLVPTFPVGCHTQPLSTSFDLVVNTTSDMFLLDQVAFQLINGSSPSGSPLLVSTPDLNARFGNLTITAGTPRPFGFQPQFACGLPLPQSLVVTALLHDRRGQQQQAAVTATFR